MNKNGICKVPQQVRGIEWISTVPTKVTTWLCLPETGKYTGHSLRMTCAQWATDNGMSKTQMQHHFGWKSSSMVVRYSRRLSILKQAKAKSLDLEADKKGRNQDEQTPKRQSAVGKSREDRHGTSSRTRTEPGNQSDGKDKENNDGEVIYVQSEKRSKSEMNKENEKLQTTPFARFCGGAIKLPH